MRAGQLPQIDTATSALARVIYRAAHLDLAWQQVFASNPADAFFMNWMDSLTESQLSKYQRDERLNGQPQGPAYFGNRTYWANRRIIDGEVFTPLPTGIMSVRSFYQFYDQDKNYDLCSRTIIFGLQKGVVYFDLEPSYFLPVVKANPTVTKAQLDKLSIDIGKREIKSLKDARARYGAWGLNEVEGGPC